MRYNCKSNNKNRNNRCDIDLTKKCAYRIVKKKKRKQEKKSAYTTEENSRYIKRTTELIS